MATLYHAPNARSLRVLWTLEELGAKADVKTLPFPPREKEQIAKMLLSHHGGGDATASDVKKFVKLDVNPNITLLGLKFDGEVEELVRRFGLKDSLDVEKKQE